MGRRFRVKNMLAMYIKYNKAGLTPTTSITWTDISPVKMSIGHKSLTNLRSEMIYLQGKPVFLYLPTIYTLRFVDNGHLCGCKRENRSRDIFRLSVVLGFYHCLTKYILEVHILAPCNLNFEFLVFRIYIW